MRLGTIDLGRSSGEWGGPPPAALIDVLVREMADRDPTPRVAFRDGRRFVARRVAASSSHSARHAPVHLKPHGVYLITGGLTGLGAAHAEHLARTVGARLVLVGRTPLQRGPLPIDPDGRHRGQGERAALVLRLESLGSEVLTIEADVSNRSDVLRVVETARARFGHIDGVFHAAGVLADSPLALKSSDQIERVFAPKAKGAILLDEALDGEALDFVVLFSSTSAEIGIPGQVDYSAASAFLNALAHDRWSRTQQPTIAIDWGVWQDIGLAARAASAGASTIGGASTSGGSAARGALSLDTISATEAKVVREGHFRASESWVLDGHRLASGRAVLPGTATFALAIGTLQQLPDWSSTSRTLVFENLSFLAPLLVDDEAPTRVRTSLSKTATGYEYRMRSESAPNAWTDHVQARVSWRDSSRRSVDLASLRTSFARVDEHADTLRTQRRHVRFGPEWSCTVDLARHATETMATLEAAAHDDASPWGADPALLDVAMTSVLPLLESAEDRLWVPRGCASVRIFDAIPRRLVSHSRLRPGADAASVRADVTLVSLDGSVVAEFEGVELAAVTPARLASVERSAATADAPRSAFAAMVAHGIAQDEGLRALERVLAAPQPNVMVSSIGLDALRRHVKLASEPSAGGGPKFARPSHVRSTFVGPRTPTEGRVLALWQDVLGIDGIGIHDDFFELGGDSLSGLRLFSQIRRVFDVNFPIDTLFTAPTIATGAALLDAEVASPAQAGHLQRSAPTSSSIVPIQTAGTRPPLYCVHEQNGYVLSYRELSHHLGDDQPFYGFQASGLDGTNEFDLTIEAMATRYVRALVVAQPAGPYYLAGSSLGGLVVYEMARQLHDLGREVALVALFDSWTPAALRPIRKVRQETNVEYLRRHVREFANLGAWRYLQERFEKRRERLAAKLLKADMRARIAGHLASNTEMPYELLQMHLEMIYERAYLTYGVPPYAGTVTLFRAIDRWHRLDNEPALGWDREKLGGLDIHHAPGRHGFMVREPHVAQLAAMLRREIDNACASTAAAPAPQARGAASG
jgi:thioesterase domain-containing protein/NAD(P)-dependent dehydrogenase (short-subunit alcohol dehydrogenase family)/acyl carrier protein